jgi:hypothetical protein
MVFVVLWSAFWSMISVIKTNAKTKRSENVPWIMQKRS